MCNSANPDFKANIADEFYDKNPYAVTVVGWDGGVAFLFKSKNPFTEVNTDHPTDNRTTFDHFREHGKNPNREPGKVEKTHTYPVQGTGIIWS